MHSFPFMAEFVCKECGKTFQAEDALAQHVSAKHLSSQPKPASQKSQFNFAKHKLLIGGLILLLIVLATGFWAFSSSQAPGKYDAFAQCLTDNGVKMYGAYWCPHCNNQKELFGNSFKYVTYVECAIEGSSDQTIACKNAKVDTYPTWEFKDGSRLSGELPLSTLASKSGCALNN